MPTVPVRGGRITVAVGLLSILPELTMRVTLTVMVEPESEDCTI